MGGDRREVATRAPAWEVPDGAHSVVLAYAHEIARLCMDHANHRLPYDAPVGVRQLSSPFRPPPSPQMSIVKTARFVRGRGTELLGTELLGILRGNDAQISRGKTIHAQGLLASHRKHES